MVVCQLGIVSASASGALTIPILKERSEFMNLKETCVLIEHLKEKGYTLDEILELLKRIAEKRYR